MPGRRQLHDTEVRALIRSWELGKADQYYALRGGFSDVEPLEPLHCYLGWTLEELAAWRIREATQPQERCTDSADGMHYRRTDGDTCRFCEISMITE